MSIAIAVDNKRERISAQTTDAVALTIRTRLIQYVAVRNGRRAIAKVATTPTRVSADIAAAAASVALSENRSATEQINYWVRIGMQIERSGSINTRRVLAVAAGEGQFSVLTTEERVVFYDNSADTGPDETASYRYGVADYAPRWPSWTPHPLPSL